MPHLRTWILRLGMALLGVATIVGWVAVGRLAEATTGALAATEATLGTAEDVAVNTAKIADRLTEISVAIDAGLLDTAAALEATASVSVNLRDTLSFIERFSGNVEDLNTSLENAETSIAKVVADLRDANGSLKDTQPALDAAAAALGKVPDDIRVGRLEVRESIREIDRQVSLWRVALVLAALALGALFIVSDGLVRAMKRDTEQIG